MATATRAGVIGSISEYYRECPVGFVLGIVVSDMKGPGNPTGGQRLGSLLIFMSSPRDLQLSFIHKNLPTELLDFHSVPQMWKASRRRRWETVGEAGGAEVGGVGVGGIQRLMNMIFIVKRDSTH